VAAGLGARVDVILDAGPSEYGIESTVVAVEEAGVVLLRPGAIDAEALEEIAGPLRGESEAGAVRSPGRLPRHYAPRTVLRVIHPDSVPMPEREGSGLLAFSEASAGYTASRILSPLGDLREAAARFFDALHELDDLALARIDAQPLPQRGLGAAMMDRLARAAEQRNV
jgi:L-threonylcarbamoyladenylate synthase